MLEVKNIKKAFNNQTVLNEISLTINPGEVVTIIGPSGSGKSTLLRTMNLLEEIDAGDIFLNNSSIIFQNNGKNLNQKQQSSIRKEISMVFQSFNLFPHKTVLENLIEGPIQVKKENKEEAINRALTLLKKVGMLEKKDMYPHSLSGGQQQRVAIARSLAMNPQMILFDEPTSALDPELVGEVLQVMKTLANEGMTMVIVTHEMNFAREVSDRILFLDNGKVQYDGPPQKFFKNQGSDARIQKFLNAVQNK